MSRISLTYFKNQEILQKKDYVKCQVYAAKVEETKVAYFYWTLQPKKPINTLAAFWTLR